MVAPSHVPFTLSDGSYAQILDVESQDPVTTASPLGLTDRQEILDSWSVRVQKGCADFKMSHPLHLASSYPANKILPDLEKPRECTLLEPGMLATSFLHLSSKIRTCPSSEPVPNASPLGKKDTALMSSVWHLSKLWTALSTRISQSFAVKSHEPEMNVNTFLGLFDRDKTSAS